MIRDGKPINHSGKDGGWGNTLAFILLYIAFCGCIFAMGFWDFESVWGPGLIALGLAVVTFIVPKELLGRSDSVNQKKIHDKSNAPATSAH